MSIPVSSMDETVSMTKNTADLHFEVYDWAMFVLLLVVSVVIGIFSALRNRRNATTHEYLLGGSSMPPLAVGLSLLGGRISANSMLGKSSEAHSLHAE